MNLTGKKQMMRSKSKYLSNKFKKREIRAWQMKLPFKNWNKF